ncbi:hypothetical protein ACSCBZ_42615 [Streptomyces niveiscabiei]|uniref:hypothetical protein n=1 Tax=Streptomyces niveiscabiei TaxID=164115 RepID=UPI00131BF934|nr:hypothetical protein [Streptomyces niveiscabiei]
MAPTETPPVTHEHDEPRGALTSLLRGRREELGKGIDWVTRHAVDPVTGDGMKKGRLWRLEGREDGGITPPNAAELRAIAAGYQLPLERLQDAAGSQFHGRDPLRTGTGEAVAYVRKLDLLTDEQRENLFRLIDSMVPPQSGDAG